MKLKHGTGHRDKLADRVRRFLWCRLSCSRVEVQVQSQGDGTVGDIPDIDSGHHGRKQCAEDWTGIERERVVPRSDHPCGCENPLLSQELAGSPLCGGDGPMVLRFTPLVGAEAMQRSKEGQLGE
ncbi:hypothetical protein B0T13DRAFT_199475 [Neurospora crassa]|nr:hypothetical protein B0T13DRAFT_199475 [Neurospora crassa]